MKLLIIMLLFLPFSLFSQDYLKLTNGDVFNCKIITVDKSEVVFMRDSVTKKVPYYLVEKIMYNSTVSSEKYNTDTLRGIPYSIDKGDVIQDYAIKDIGLDGANTWLTISLIGGISTLGLAIGNISMDEPQEPIYDSDPIKKSKQMEQYAKDAKDYTDSKIILTNSIYITGAISIVSAAIGGIKIVNFIEKRDGSLLLSQKGSGFSLCYKF